jgi:hypothetical protein
MQIIRITFAEKPVRQDVRESMSVETVVIERYAHTHKQTEDIVKAANVLQPDAIQILEAE